ncbi:MAG: DUF2231 domain-containing protein [Ignavibacteriales bacterium]|nr:DUF2231 domain-containing protein [Ignavibacteriales bacterium]
MEFLSQIHPRIVHFPVAFFIMYFILETFGMILKKDHLVKAAYLLLIAGVFTALIAVLTGNQAYTAAKLLIGKKSDLNELIEIHENYATITVWYFSAVLIFRTYLMAKKKIWKSITSENNNLKYAFVLLGLIGCYLIYMTGIHGGDLVFQHGIGTQIFVK